MEIRSPFGNRIVGAKAAPPHKVNRAIGLWNSETYMSILETASGTYRIAKGSTQRQLSGVQYIFGTKSQENTPPLPYGAYFLTRRVSLLLHIEFLHYLANPVPGQYQRLS